MLSTSVSLTLSIIRNYSGLSCRIQSASSSLRLWTVFLNGYREVVDTTLALYLAFANSAHNVCQDPATAGMLLFVPLPLGLLSFSQPLLVISQAFQQLEERSCAGLRDTP